MVIFCSPVMVILTVHIGIFWALKPCLIGDRAYNHRLLLCSLDAYGFVWFISKAEASKFHFRMSFFWLLMGWEQMVHFWALFLFHGDPIFHYHYFMQFCQTRMISQLWTHIWHKNTSLKIIFYFIVVLDVTMNILCEITWTTIREGEAGKR
jgi:hypothetical protein